MAAVTAQCLGVGEEESDGGRIMGSGSLHYPLSLSTCRVRTHEITRDGWKPTIPECR
jgi:hypothetical protein